VELIRKKRDLRMTEGPVLNKIIRFMLPLMITNLLQVFYNAADMMVVELSGVEDAVGAVGTTSAFVALITNVLSVFRWVPMCWWQEISARRMRRVFPARCTQPFV